MTEVRRDTTLGNNRRKPRQSRKLFLKAQLADHSGFMNDRLNSFVGRKKELVEIRQRIAEKQQTGGYITITGQAGQGKSSIIAQLVKEYGPENVAFHFIPFNPGTDHQIGLLRNLMARLILKYDLPDLYVAAEGRAALCDYFFRVLRELAAEGGQEIIFIDGLDQLEEDANGVRDLSFLPNDLPQGVVFVLGTRPNDILRPLELLKPCYEYQLPNLSRQDFDLLLHHHRVQLDRNLADRFYQVTEGNALYLSLVVKELATREASSPETLIKQLALNTEHLFSLVMARLKQLPDEWHEIIKPVLGVLLVARESLGLQHIQQILGVEDDRLRDGIERLGELIICDWQQRYSLFHLKFYEYLRQDKEHPAKEYVFATNEEQNWHKRLAQWCEGNDLSTIWPDVKHDPIEQWRREYARQHYVTHLYHAHEWERLFAVIDTAQYGKAKIRNDPSTRSYAQDLDLGRQAATWEGWTFEQSIALLPRLWQYTLLRCSLKSRADRYPLVAFRLLILLKRKQEALRLAELLTKPADKVRAFLAIVESIRGQSGQKREWLALLLRAAEIARTIGMGEEVAIMEVAIVLAQAQYWWQAEAMLDTIEKDSYWRAEALGKLAAALAQAQQWEQAEEVIGRIEDSYWQDEALGELAAALAQAQHWERAESIIDTMEKDSYLLAKVLRQLATIPVDAQQWE